MPFLYINWNNFNKKLIDYKVGFKNEKFDNAITQIIFVEYPEGVEVMHLTKVYKNGCLVDYELIYADGTSDEFCEKWNSDFIDCGNLSPITIKASDFKEFKKKLMSTSKIYFSHFDSPF